MKLTEEQRKVLLDTLEREFGRIYACESIDAGPTVAAFLAGCAWQREQDAKLVDGYIERDERGAVRGATAQLAAIISAAIRAQGDDR